MKKVLCLVVLVASVVLLIACGPASDTNESGDQVVIRFSMWDVVDESDNFIVAFHEANPDIKIEILNLDATEYSTIVNTMVVGGTAPDVILAWEVDLPRFARNGSILKLDDKINDSDLVDVSDLMPAVDELAKMTEGIYGIPWVYASHFLYYNKDMFDAAGIDYPTEDWTWQDIEDAAVALTIREGNNTTQWGMNPIPFGGVWYSLIGAAGDDVIDSNLNFSMGPGLRRTLEFFDRMTNELEVMPQPGVEGNLFEAEMAAMRMMGNWEIPAYQEAPFNWDIISMPRDERKFQSLHTGMFTISAASEHPDEAWRFIEFLMSYEGQVLLSEFSGNPSVIMSVAAEGPHFVQGLHGPSNWDAFKAFNDYGRFTYTLLNPAVTGDLAGQFDAVLLGLTTIDNVVNVEVPAAQARQDSLD